MARREAQRPALPTIPCMFPSCMHAARLRVKTPSGLANVCIEHDLFFAQTEAAIFCEAKGLTDVNAMRDYCKTSMRGFGRKSFSDWAGTLTPESIALITQVWGPGSKILAKLKDAGHG